MYQADTFKFELDTLSAFQWSLVSLLNELILAALLVAR